MSKFYSQNNNNYSTIHKNYNNYKTNIASMKKKTNVSIKSNKSINNNKIINVKTNIKEKKNNPKNNLSKEKKNIFYSYIRKPK